MSFFIISLAGQVFKVKFQEIGNKLQEMALRG